MAELKIFREHTLGLAQARRVAQTWAAQAEKDFGMACCYTEGPTRDSVSFMRSGVKGDLQVDEAHFELHVTLGFLFGAFKEAIEAEIVKNLDALLAEASV